jgi:hypothetical protein
MLYNPGADFCQKFYRRTYVGICVGLCGVGVGFEREGDRGFSCVLLRNTKGGGERGGILNMSLKNSVVLEGCDSKIFKKFWKKLVPIFRIGNMARLY